MDRLLSIFLSRFIHNGSLTVTTAAGNVYTFGDGSGTPVSVRLTNATAQRAVLLDPELRLGEAYMDGSLVVERGSIADLLEILFRQERIAAPTWALPPRAIRHSFRRVQQFNPRSRSRRNVAHHYDLDGRLYQLFLDADQQYSCAYFEHAASSPRGRTARQEAAHRGEAAASSPGARCSISAAAGAGSPSISPRLPARRSPASRFRRSRCARAESAAERGPGRAASLPARRITARRRAASTASSRSACSSTSASATTTTFSPSARRSSPTTASCCCTRSAAPSARRSPIPGSPNTSSPAATSPHSRRCAGDRARRPVVTDVEILRLHYAETLKAWRAALPRPPRRGRALYDERFCRMWEFYLAASEAAFRDERHGRLPDPDGQAQGRRTADPRLYRAARKRGCARSKAACSAPLRLAGE